jgi:F-type H+-transporting ATPase subunit a
MTTSVVRLRTFALPLLAAALVVCCVGGLRADEHPKDHPHADKKGEGPHEAGKPGEHPAGEHHGHSTDSTAMTFHHVIDDTTIPLSKNVFGIDEIKLPAIPLPFRAPFQITKFMVLELIAALLMCVIFITMSRFAVTGEPRRTIIGGAFEAIVVWIRETMAKPAFGEHHADEHVPFLCTAFFFILFNNLFGLVPFMGSATANINVTVVLALFVFFAIHGSAIKEHGFKGYMESFWPHFDVPFPLNYIIKPLVFVIEIIGVLVRNVVLAVRLFANVFAGHMVLATILVFIFTARQLPPALWGTVTAASVIGIVLLSLLEIFVAFLQAFIFTFLASLFMGMAVHPPH